MHPSSKTLKDKWTGIMNRIRIKSRLSNCQIWKEVNQESHSAIIVISKSSLFMMMPVILISIVKAGFQLEKYGKWF